MESWRRPLPCLTAFRPLRSAYSRLMFFAALLGEVTRPHNLHSNLAANSPTPPACGAQANIGATQIAAAARITDENHPAASAATTLERPALPRRPRHRLRWPLRPSRPDFQHETPQLYACHPSGLTAVPPIPAWRTMRKNNRGLSTILSGAIITTEFGFKRSAVHCTCLLEGASSAESLMTCASAPWNVSPNT